jgi:Uma2 family endonuclease
VEILSPRDSVVEMQERIGDYLKFGVRYVWLIDSKTGLTFVHAADGVQEIKNGLLSTKDPDIQVSLAEPE